MGRPALRASDGFRSAAARLFALDAYKQDLPSRLVQNSLNTK